jgi:hypothetical protein
MKSPRPQWRTRVHVRKKKMSEKRRVCVKSRGMGVWAVRGEGRMVGWGGSRAGAMGNGVRNGGGGVWSGGKVASHGGRLFTSCVLVCMCLPDTVVVSDHRHGYRGGRDDGA